MMISPDLSGSPHVANPTAYYTGNFCPHFFCFAYAMLACKHMFNLLYSPFMHISLRDKVCYQTMKFPPTGSFSEESKRNKIGE